MGVSTDSEDSMDWHLWDQVYDRDHGNSDLESTEMEVERDELKEELEKGDMQMEYIRIEMELEIDELNEELKERDKKIEDIKDFIRDFLLVKKNQKMAQYWQEKSIPTEVELQDQECNEGPLYSHLVFSGVDFDIVRHSHTYPDLDRGLKLSDEDLEDLELGINLICSSLSSALTFEMDRRMEIRDKDVCGMQEICEVISLFYKGLSTLLQDQTFFFGERPTSLDALFIGHALFVVHVVREESVLHEKLFEYPNLVNHATVHGHEVMAVRPQSISEILSRTFGADLVMALGNGSSSHASRLDKGKGPMVVPEPEPEPEPKPTRGKDYSSEVPLSQVEEKSEEIGHFFQD